MLKYHHETKRQAFSFKVWEDFGTDGKMREQCGFREIFNRWLNFSCIYGFTPDVPSMIYMLCKLYKLYFNNICRKIGEKELLASGLGNIL